MTTKIASLGDLIPKYLGKEAKPKHAIALMGGGLDGFLAAHSLLMEYPSITKLTLLFFDYGQSSADIELAMVVNQASYFQYRHKIEAIAVDLKDNLAALLKDTDLCTKEIYHIMSDRSISVPAGAHLPENKQIIENLKIYIPNRNARFVTQAFGIAEILRADVITLGAVGNVNMDNSLAFIDAACAMHKVSGDRPVAIYAPFVLMSKSFVAYYANSYGLNATNIDDSTNVLRDATVSCFFPMQASDGVVKHCGNCRSCLTLRQGFKFAAVADPYCYSN